MATALKFLVNIVDGDVDYATTPGDFVEVDLTNDYLIWTKGNTVVKDLMTHEPTAGELNAAAEVIDPALAVSISKCLLMDYSHNVGGAYYTHLVKGMGENKKYAFCFAFDGATATEPQLEVWDTNAHNTAVLNALGLGTPANSMVKGVCTTTSLPGSSWAGAPLAGANVLLLNDGNGALSVAGNLYANLKIVIPANYSVPAGESFVFTLRHTWA